MKESSVRRLARMKLEVAPLSLLLGFTLGSLFFVNDRHHPGVLGFAGLLVIALAFAIHKKFRRRVDRRKREEKEAVSKKLF